MKATLTKLELEAALKIAAAVSKPKTAWGEWVLLDSKAGFASQGTHVRVEVLLPQSSFSEEGKLLVQEKTLRDLLPNLDPVLEVTERKNHLDLVSGKFRSRLVGLDPRNYPPCQEAEAADAVPLPLPLLQQAVRDVEFAIAEDVDRSSKSALTGLTLRAGGGKLEVIGARDPLLAIARLPLEGRPEFSLTLPRELCSILLKLDGKVVSLSGFRSPGRRLQAAGVTVRTSLVQGSLPDLSAVLSRPRPITATVVREELKRGLRQIEAFKDRNSKIMTITLLPKLVRLSAISQTAGKAVTEIEADVVGVEERVVFGLDIDHLAGILDRIGSEKVALEVGSRNELVAVVTEDRTYVAITSVPDKDFDDE